MNSGNPKIAKVQTRFRELSNLATSLNAASDEFTKIVGTLDEALKKLNVGLTVWLSFRFRGDDNEPQIFDQDQIGYAKVSATWGIVLRRIWGDEERDIYHEDGPWLFKDAPRELRLAAADKIPELIEALAKAASTTTKEVLEKTQQVRELAAAIDEVSNAGATFSPQFVQDALAAASKQVAAKLSDLNPKGGK